MSASRLCLDVAGLPVALDLQTGALDPAMRARYRPFLSGAAPRYRLELRMTEGARLPGAWRPAVAQERSLLRCRSSQFHWELEVSGDRGGGHGHALLRRTAPALDSLLRVFYSAILRWEGGALLHAAALWRRRQAYLFVGPSGAGKTTWVRKLVALRGVRSLSDELVLLRRGPQGLRVHSTPFWGEFRRPENNGAAPLKKVFFLEKTAGRTRLIPLGVGEAQRRLLRCLVSFERAREPIERAWGLLLEAARGCPSAALRWNKGDAAAELARCMA